MRPAGRFGAAEIAVLSTLVVGAGFSYYQLGSGLFACGMSLAGPQAKYWMAFAALQSLLLMAGSFSAGARGTYRLLQYLSLPLVAVPLAQLALANPRIFVALAIVAAPYLLLMRWRRSPPITASGALLETTLFVLATLIIHSAVVFFVLHSYGMHLSDRMFLMVLVASAVVAAWLVTRENAIPPISIAHFPPLGLLVVVLLRAKLPDGAYDSLFYKATLPITIADWRTAITGALDHTLLGTDFGEIINSQLRILDPSYSPALNSTFSFLALWVIVPFAAEGVFRWVAPMPQALARSGFVLLVASLSEPLIAAGTAYHEPLLSLLLAGSLLPMSVSWLFFGTAIALKATALFIAPLMLVVKAWPLESPRMDALRRLRERPAVLAACLLLAALVVGEQFYRNLAYTGRLTGITESLAGLTDPQGKVLARQSRDVFLTTRLGFRERYLNTFIHVLTLDRWITPHENGFHIIPTSRLMALAVVLALLVIAIPALRRQRVLVISFAVWLLCAAALLQFVTQGRHLFSLSFAAAVLIAAVVARLPSLLSVGAKGHLLALTMAVSVSILAIGDQLVGSFINDGWDCRRNFETPVVANDYDRPQTKLELRLAEIAARYRAGAGRLDAIPSIVCENTVDRVRYVGVHYVFAYPSFDLTVRHLAAQPAHRALLPTSLLAVCFTSETFADQLLPADVRGQFAEVAPVKTENAGLVRILVSRPLMAGAKATSLVGKQMPSLAHAVGSMGPGDLMPLWSADRLTNSLPADAPGGKGAFVMDAGGERVGVLISPFAVQFEDIDFDAVRGLEVELAMPYSNSDGMAVEFAFEGSNGARAATPLSMTAKPEAAPAPAWESHRIPVPTAVKGRGTLTVTASSPTGNSNADWLFFRRLKLVGAGRDEGNRR